MDVLKLLWKWQMVWLQLAVLLELQVHARFILPTWSCAPSLSLSLSFCLDPLFTDMPIFGQCPAQDDFYLVMCSQCGHVVKPQAFQAHYGKCGTQSVGLLFACVHSRDSALHLPEVICILFEKELINSSDIPKMLTGHMSNLQFLSSEDKQNWYPLTWHWQAVKSHWHAMQQIGSFSSKLKPFLHTHFRPGTSLGYLEVYHVKRLICVSQTSQNTNIFTSTCLAEIFQPGL